MKKIKNISGKQFKYLSHLIWVVILIMIIFSVWFLYNNFYQSIINSNEVVILEGSDALERMNIEKINKVLDFQQKKISPRQLEIELIFQ